MECLQKRHYNEGGPLWMLLQSFNDTVLDSVGWLNRKAAKFQGQISCIITPGGSWLRWTMSSWRRVGEGRVEDYTHVQCRVSSADIFS